ncbi:uncharacterized protein LOC135113439 [Scylla paramamosain]|uniref:uncharacterized protein LOC135113439 n=1 Tax=Scylla paramamosain TaxID=85552 RepID=UPI00308375E1
MSSQFHWSHDAITSLLEKVRDHEVLWNIRHPHYPKKTMKRRIFEEIRNQLIQTHPEMASLTADDLFGKLSYLHGNFRRVLHKVRNTPSGSGGKPEPKWEYFKACSFLLPVYDNHSFQSSLELPPREDVVYEGTLEDLVQLDFSPLYSPRSIGISHPSSAASTSLSIDAPCTPPESQTPSPQGPVDTAKLQAVVYSPEPQEGTHTQSPHNVVHTPAPQDIVHTPAPQDVLHTVSHPSKALGTSTPGTSVTPRGKKRNLTNRDDTSEKIVQTVDKVRNVMDAFIQNKLEKKSGKHDFVISGVE